MTRDMTSGSPLRHLLAFSWPLFLGNIIQNAYAVADAIIVGRYLGEEALAAVGGISSSLFVIIGFIFGITSGACVVTGQMFGAKKFHALRLSVGTGFLVCMGTVALVTSLCLLFLHSILNVLNTPAPIYSLAEDYLRVSFYGIVCMGLFNFQSATLRALGDSRTPLYFLAVASLVNIALDIFFINGLGMGIAGAAWATNAAILLSAVLCFFLVTRRIPELRLSRSDWRPRPRMAWKQLVIAIPMALQFSITGLGAMVLQRAINTFGAIQIAGMTAARQIEMVACQLPVALGQAMASYSAQNFGAGKLQRIREGVNACVWMVVISSVALTLLTIFWGQNFIGIFIKEGTENTAEVIRIGKQMLLITSPFFFPLGCIFIYRNTLQGIGRSFLPMMAGVVEMFMRAGVALFLLPFLGVQAVYWGDPAAWVGAWVLLGVSYFAIFRTLRPSNEPEIR